MANYLPASILGAAFLWILAAAPTQAQIFLRCSGSNYTVPSPFKRNLDLLLSNLSTVPDTAGLGYFRSASVQGTDAVYVLIQCRGDILPNDCADCLNLTVSDIADRCPIARRAAIRQDDCLLRYSDRPLLGVSAHRDVLALYNAQNTSIFSDPSLFDNQLMELLAEVMSQASAGASRFAAGMRNYTSFQYIYALAQCTRDLPESGCDECLRYLMPRLPSRTIGAQVLAASCLLRFEIYPFFSLSVVPPPPFLPPPPALKPPTSINNAIRAKKRNQLPKTLLVVVIVAVVAGVISSLIYVIICLRRKAAARAEINRASRNPEDSLLLDIKTLRVATGNFCEENKLGEGGFGPVYKGFLPDGREIAVKRLSGRSDQGLAEMRNEVLLAAKLHHKNLVRLLGFCLEEEEKILVYEYLPNRSLDKFLFDPSGRFVLDWERRQNLIVGIARGLLYLHEDSRLRIIHRDLKPENILLDEHMNPKISDFGLAKLFTADETQGRTNRIAGTLGYMAPEYAMGGRFSTKLDVFSFGVLTLEIVTGRRNSDYHESGNAIDLLGDVWSQWCKGEALQLLDRAAGERWLAQEVLWCIHIGLLCVQEDQSMRPSMSDVALMLSSISMTLPAPSRPAFVFTGPETWNSDDPEWRARSSEHSGSGPGSTSNRENTPLVRAQTSNTVTISDLEPR